MGKGHLRSLNSRYSSQFGSLVDPEEYDRSLEFLARNGVKVFLEQHREGASTFTGRSAYVHEPDRNVIELLDPADG